MKKSLIFMMLFSLCVTGFAFASEEAGHGPVLDGHYWWTQLVKFVNVAIVIGALFYFLRKPVAGFFKKRAAQIEEDLKAAERAREEAEARLKEVEQKVTELEGKVEEIKAKAVEEGEVEKQRIISQAKEESGRIMAMTDREITSRVKSGQKELKRYASQLAVERARQMIIEKIDGQLDQKIINSTINSMGENK